MRTFATNDKAMTSYLYHKLLGHEIPDQTFDIDLPDKISPPTIPELNESQQHAVRSVLRKPLSLIQGNPFQRE